MKLRERLKKESETQHSQFVSIVEKLRTSYLTFATPVFYTSHGIDHSENVEGIADKLISDQLKDEMNVEEIFILLCSIYFHDVGMALLAKGKGADGADDYFKQVDEARRMHSAKTASFMIQKYEEFGLTAPQAEIIGQICKAHSDIKNEDGTKIYTFKEIMERSDEVNIDITPIRIKFLAAILRLADELDITSRRAPGKRMEIAGLPTISQIEWMKHQIFGGVHIDSASWEIDLDISEALLYGENKSAGDRMALTNKLVTDVAIKIRKSLTEVKPPLLKEGALYRNIQFRDLMITKLNKIFIEYGVDSDGTTFLYDIQDNNGDRRRVQIFFYEVEKLELSPEYCVSRTIDDRLFQSVDFLRNIENNHHITAGDIADNDGMIKRIQDSIIGFLGKYVKRRGLERRETYKNGREEYLAYIDFAGGYLLEMGGFEEFSSDLHYEINDIIESEDRFKEETDYTNLLVEMIHDDILKDLFLQKRRRVMLDKFKSHHYVHIIAGSYFSSISTDVREALTYLKYLMDESNGNFKLYYHDGDINLEYRIITSELVLIPGRSPDSSLVVTETESVIQFYDDFHRILASDNTWFIEDIDTNNLRIKLGRDDRFQGGSGDGSNHCEVVETRLNAILSGAVNGNTDTISDDGEEKVNAI